MNAIAEVTGWVERHRPAYEPYVFTHDDDRNETLRRLEAEHGGKRTSPLWKAFLAYDRARAAYEAEVAKRQRWQAELHACRQHVDEVEQEQDPDTVDYPAYSLAKAEILARRLSDPHGMVRELKDVLDRAGENWASLWERYERLQAHVRLVEQAQFVPVAGMHDPQPAAARGI